MSVQFNPIKLGVIADSHIPDRIPELPSELLVSLRDASVDRIIHAGDACNRQVIHTLEEIAPVTIVQGNRDWLFGLRTPRKVEMVINNVRITIAHGHHSILAYSFYFLWVKLFKELNIERYYKHLIQDFPDADLIIFGHTHYQAAKWVGSQLLFNPGAVYPCKQNRFSPQYGIITITAEGIIRTEFHQLESSASKK
jgi:putative phosphoesterase